MKSTNTLLTEEQTEALSFAIDIAQAHEGENDRRAVSAYCNAFDLLVSLLRETKLKTERTAVLKEFKGITGLKAVDLIENLYCPCLNTAQYARYLDVLDRAIELRLIDESEFVSDRVEILVCLGNVRGAEELGRQQLESKPDDILSYVLLGDIYYFFERLNERQDLKKAESWYYQAYDKFGWSEQHNEDWEMLVERLTDITIQKLRRSAYRRLLELLQARDIGSFETLHQLIRAVWIVGYDSPILAHMQDGLICSFREKGKDLDKVNHALKVFQDAYNLMPQKGLEDGNSPFEMSIMYPQGPYAHRILKEKNQAMLDYMESLSPGHQMLAEDFERISEIQEDFMQEKDLETGKRRSKLLEDEQKEIQHRVDNGEMFWTGFTEFRNTDILP